MIHARLPAFNGERLRDRNYVTACGEPAAGPLVISDPVPFVMHRAEGVGLPPSRYCPECEKVLRVLVRTMLETAREIAAGVPDALALRSLSDSKPVR